MDQSQWQAVQAIFSHAVELPVAERQAAVHEMCAGDAVLLAEVADLLKEDAREQRLLDSSLDRVAGSVLDIGLEIGQLPLYIERQIGPYRLLETLGEGGMGVVYLAERTDIGGKVAIKLLRDPWLSPMRRERFHFEQLTLAQLNHPSIARIYDSNTLEDGTPWFVMEYADGLPLTNYWKQSGGSIRDGLRLMKRVCEAVQYAHSHAIIHRDLKPSNILVTADGAVKLLDFGIAKQLTGEDVEDHRTITGLRLMTLAYAAPEQLTGAAVGVYTDVYALGVLLYELLADRLPVRVPGSEIENPSAIVRRERLELLSQLSKSEWADIDLIARKALEPEVENRYGTAGTLIRELDAFLEGRPLETRRAEWYYPCGKFLKRNRRPLLAVATTLVVIAGTVIFYTLRLEQARNAAVNEAARTLRIQQFTESLFDGGQASVGPAADLRAVELLDRGRHEAEGLGNDPEMQADLRATLGGIYQKLGKLDVADPLLVSALAERRQQAEPDQDKIGNSLVALGMLRKEQGKQDAAEALVREGITTLQNQKPQRRATVAGAMVSLGSVLEVRSKYDEAKNVLESALKLQPQNAEAADSAAENLTELANVNFYKGDNTASETLNLRALDIYRRLYGEQHPAVAGILNNLGAIEMNRENYAVSEKYYRRALSITETWYGADHPETAANLTALAQPVSFQKRNDEAQFSSREH